MRRIALSCCLVTLLALPSTADQPPALREGASHSVPLHGELLQPYDAPEDPFAPGHRGADVGAPSGTPVRASASGTVSFAGNVAGNRTVTVVHGEELVTSYSFLGSTAVTAGRVLARGDVVGAVGTGHPGSGMPPHVHLSARRSGAYFDPLELYVGSSWSDLLSLVG